MRKPSEKWQLLADTLENHNMETCVSAFRAFLHLSHMVDKYLDARLSADGVNHTQRIILLLILLNRGYLTPTEISRSTFYILDTINKSIDSLEKMGITKSYNSKKDRRIRRVSLTEKGLDLAEISLPARYHAFIQAMDCLTEEEAMILQSLSERLTENLLRIMTSDSTKSENSSSFNSPNEPFESPRHTRKRADPLRIKN